VGELESERVREREREKERGGGGERGEGEENGNKGKKLVQSFWLGKIQWVIIPLLPLSQCLKHPLIMAKQR
jgi:hypothetical protein